MTASRRADLEDQLVAIWERALAVGPIDVWQNFFDLGGDALTAAGMVCEIERATGKRLSFRSIVEAPTIMQLADRIHGQVRERRCKRRAA